MLQPGVHIRPQINTEEAKDLAERLYGVSVTNIQELNAYDDKNYHVKVAASTRSVSLEQPSPDGYVLKILNSMDSLKLSFVEAQNEMMIYLGAKGIRCTQPMKNLNGQLYSVETIPVNSNHVLGADGTRHVVRLLKFEPGEILHNVPLSYALCRQAGSYLASLDVALAGFSHDAYHGHATIWALSSVPKLSEFLYAVKDSGRRQLVTEIVEKFTLDVVPQIPSLPKGMIHGDFNEQNILVRKTERSEWEVDGILDFGDTQLNCYLFELALATCYLMLEARAPMNAIKAGGHVVAGYHRIKPLSHLDLTLLKVCVCARLCQSLVLGAYSHQQDPSNAYVLSTAQAGWEMLETLWAIPQEQLSATWLQEIRIQGPDLLG